MAPLEARHDSELSVHAFTGMHPVGDHHWQISMIWDFGFVHALTFLGRPIRRRPTILSSGFDLNRLDQQWVFMFLSSVYISSGLDSPR